MIKQKRSAMHELTEKLGRWCRILTRTAILWMQITARTTCKHLKYAIKWRTSTISLAVSIAYSVWSVFVMAKNKIELFVIKIYLNYCQLFIFLFMSYYLIYFSYIKYVVSVLFIYLLLCKEKLFFLKVISFIIIVLLSTLLYYLLKSLI